MSSQHSVSNVNGNLFGEGAKLDIKCTNTRKVGENVQETTSHVIVDHTKPDDAGTNELIDWLKKIRLENILVGLTELGAEDLEDMLELEDDDLETLQLKKIPMKRLKRAIAKLEEDKV